VVTRDSRAHPVTSAADDTSALGSYIRLLITDAVLLAPDVAPEAKLAPAAVLNFRGRGNPSIADLRKLLRTRRTSVLDGQRLAAEQGWLKIKSGHDSKPRGAKYYPVNRYTLADIANPYARLGFFVQLALTPSLGTKASRWILRAFYLREQRISGAVQVPLGIGARLAGIGADAEEKARQTWIEAGEMEKVYDADQRHPATFILRSAEHPPDLGRFDPDKRRLRTFGLRDGRRLTVWGTRKQARLIEGLASWAGFARVLARSLADTRPAYDTRELKSLLTEEAFWAEMQLEQDERAELAEARALVADA
jgi:hypothetical protein